jgi:hypothetical protein
MAEQIRELDAAAELAAAKIREASEQLRDAAITAKSATRADLLAGLGSALVDRTEEIRGDCRRLSDLMERTAKLVADRDAREPVEAAPSPAAETLSPYPAAEPLRGGLDQPPLADIPASVLRDGPFVSAEETQPPVDRPVEYAARREPAAVSEGVRLIATQMAIAGSSRAEIERRLRSQFGVRDADLALDDIFGSRGSEVR